MTRIAGKRMRKFFSISMAVWLLVLAVTGWCCHQPCECAHAAPEAPTLAHSVRCCSSLWQPVACAEDCCNDTHDPSPPCTPCKDHTQCLGVCIYLPTKASPVEGKLLLATFYVGSLDSSPIGMQVIAALCCGWTSEFVGPAPPSRLHVLHQVFLI
jgi:hypothetical protein